jgi:hypothetical protein
MTVSPISPSIHIHTECLNGKNDGRDCYLAALALADFLEFFSIPAMSTEPERVFSGAKITIFDRGCQLSDKAVNA